MDSRQLLVYFFVKYKGEWEGIYKAISDKEEVDEGKVKEVVSEYLKEHKVMTLLDDSEFMVRIKTVMKPPFVVEYSGDADLLNQVGKTTIGTDSTDMGDCLVANGYTVAEYIEGESGAFIQIRNKDKKLSLKESKDKISLALRLGQYSGKLLINNEDIDPFYNAVISTFISAGRDEIYAVPGKSGSNTNKLIKEGVAQLCDCPEDLAWDKKEED